MITTDEHARYGFPYEPPSTTTSGSEPAPPEPRRRRGGWISRLGLVMAFIIAGAAAGAAASVIVDDAPQPIVIERTIPAAAAAPAVVAGTGVDAAAVGAAVVPSIVTVQVGTGQGADFVPLASGSGVVIDDSGSIVTNNHVVADARSVRTILSDGRVYEAVILGTDALTDLAVLQISATDLVPIAFGATDGITVGQPAIAVGSPLGLDGGPSLSVGVISALGREVRTGPQNTLYGMLQTDAPITNGSSGGSLVDAAGRLIGITTAVGVSENGIEGIGFATPVEIVDRVTAEIIATGSSSKAVLGIVGSTSYRSTTDGGQAPTGVVVQSVEAGSGAASAGISEGDVITSIDGSVVRTMDELISVLRARSGGQTVRMALEDGAMVSVTLGSG